MTRHTSLHVSIWHASTHLTRFCGHNTGRGSLYIYVHSMHSHVWLPREMDCERADAVQHMHVIWSCAVLVYLKNIADKSGTEGKTIEEVSLTHEFCFAA